MICLEEKESNYFIIFSCKHKTCDHCFHSLIMNSSPCPICQQPITMYVPQTTVRNIECCKIVTGISFLSLFIFYIVNYAFKKN